MNSSIAGIDQADSILLVGTFPRWEAAMINARIRRAWFERKVPVTVIGEKRDFNYPVTYAGNGPQVLADMVKQAPSEAKNPMIIVGANVLARKDGTAIQAILSELAQRHNVVTAEWNGMNTLQLAASRVGALDLGFVPQRGGFATKAILEATKKGDIKFVYLLGVDNIDPKEYGEAFVVYQGHHGDAAAARADVILPGAAYTEKNAIYVNTEGRPQQARQASFPPGEAREDWKILRALSEKTKTALPYNTLGELRRRMKDINPIFASLDQITPTPYKAVGKAWPVDTMAFTSSVKNFYQTCVISRSSETMAKCTDAFLNTNQELKAAE